MVSGNARESAAMLGCGRRDRGVCRGMQRGFARRAGLLATMTMPALALLAGCGTSGGGRRGGPVPAPEAWGWECVPYARQRSGIGLTGDAWRWWDAAAGRYARGSAPRPGSVLVLRRTRRLPLGHVAVVARVLDRREIRVDHANWASGAAKGRVARDQPVRDLSPDNDWSLVLVWYPPVGDFGATRWPAHGFVHPVRSG